MKPAIIIVSYDGISGLYCGVGTIVKNMIFSLDKLNKKKKYDLFLVNSATSKKSLGYSKKIIKKSKQICRNNGGKVINMGSFKSQINQYGDVSRWKKNSSEVYEIIKNISKNHSKCLVILNDAPFLGVASIENRNKLKKVSFLFIPHGTGYFHSKNKKSKESRIKWEKENLYPRENFYVGYISEYMKNHLREKFNVKTHLIKLIDGIFIENHPDKKLIKSKNELISKKILKNKKVILAYGRSEPYKNLESVIRASRELNEDYFTLIIASDNTSDNPLSKNLLNLSNNNCLILPYHVNQEIIFSLIKNNPLVVVVPSLREPFGMIPSEVRYFGKKSGTIVLASNKGGLKEQIADGQDGFLIKSFKPRKLAKQIKDIFNLDLKEREKISLKGFMRVKKDYNYLKRMQNLLKIFL